MNGIKITDPRAYLAVDPPRVSSPEHRNNADLWDVLRQFDVAKNPRYVAGRVTGSETYCNIFLWDGSRALMCEIPHWIDPTTGKKTPHGKGTELNANRTTAWMRSFGMDYGWMRCGHKQAVARALDGYPTVVMWENTKGIGHVAFVVGGYLEKTLIIQAGKTNGEMTLAQGFGNAGPLEFWTHD